jgi:hypothetical protein
MSIFYKSMTAQCIPLKPTTQPNWCLVWRYVAKASEAPCWNPPIKILFACPRRLASFSISLSIIPTLSYNSCWLKFWANSWSESYFGLSSDFISNQEWRTWGGNVRLTNRFGAIGSTILVPGCNSISLFVKASLNDAAVSPIPCIHIKVNSCFYPIGVIVIHPVVS